MALSVRIFAFGAVYLISGIYSLFLSLFMEGTVQPISGYTAFVTRPDPLFPFEVLLFMMFGGAFILASLIEFRRSIGVTARERVAA